jgi:hypothetical protein
MPCELCYFLFDWTLEPPDEGNVLAIRLSTKSWELQDIVNWPFVTPAYTPKAARKSVQNKYSFCRQSKFEGNTGGRAQFKSRSLSNDDHSLLDPQ